MRSTRDLLRRRLHLVRKRGQLLAHIQNTRAQYQLPEFGRRLAYPANRTGVSELFTDPSVRKSIDVDLALLGRYDALITDLELTIVRDAKRHDGDAFHRLRSVPGIMTGTKTFTRIPARAVVIFASPHVPENWIGDSTDPAVQQAGSAYFTAVDASTEKQARAFEAGLATARVVRLRGAHYIFLSNERETLREMRAFVELEVADAPSPEQRIESFEARLVAGGR
jgi:hypothetical protein